MRHNRDDPLNQIEPPEPCLLPDGSIARRTSSHEREDEREREATELEDVAILSQRTSRLASINPSPPAWIESLSKVWRQQIRVSVPHADCRDHLGKISSTVKAMFSRIVSK